MKNFGVIVFLLINVSLYGQTIEGTVIDGVRKEVISFALIELRDSTSFVTKVTADMDGNFKFDSLSVGIYSITVHSVGYRDTTFQNINITGATKLELDIHRFCKYDLSRNDKTCPVCHKSDQAIPIHYGIPVSSKKGAKEFQKKVDVEFRLGGCEISGCDPNWYCKRDKIEF